MGPLRILFLGLLVSIALSGFAVKPAAATTHGLDATVESNPFTGYLRPNTYGIAVNNVTNTIYATNSWFGSISVFNGTSDTLRDTIFLPGGAPTGIAVDPTLNRIYVTDVRTNVTYAINGSNDVVNATIAVGNGPLDVAVDQATHLVYVTNSASDSISVLDGLRNRLVTTFPVEGTPYSDGVNSYTNTVFVSTRFPDALLVINGLTNFVMDSIPITYPLGVGVDPNTDTVYVASPLVNSTFAIIFEGQSYAVRRIVVGGSPLTIAVDFDRNLVYVTNAALQSVSVIDGNTNSLVHNIPTGEVFGGLDVNPATNKVYATDLQTYSLTIIDAVTDSIRTNIPIGHYPSGVAINDATNTVYVATNFTLTAINGATQTQIISMRVGRTPLQVAYSQDRIYVSDIGSEHLVVLDSASYQTVANLTMDSFALTVCDGSVFVGRILSNSITVLNESTLSPSASIPLDSPAVGIACNPYTNRLYVTEFETKSVAVFDALSYRQLSSINIGYVLFGVAVDPSFNRIYLANVNSNQILILNGSTNAQIGAIQLRLVPSGVAVNNVTNTIYVTPLTSGSGLVFAVDGKSDQITNTIVIPEFVPSIPILVIVVLLFTFCGLRLRKSCGQT